MPGEYQVTEVTPLGYYDGLDAPGSAGGTAHNPGDLIDAITLAPNEAATDYDFGELLPGGISGYVYADDNNDGVFDNNELPIAGVTLALLDADGNATGETTVTDANGYYEFTNLAPGIYGVVETQSEWLLRRSRHGRFRRRLGSEPWRQDYRCGDRQ